ncbi:hypothetical protein Sps_02153 [Shewanella psychrophila]|uniref:Uncharacterized protein n=1 Tax=Shewanella psychrophila TaxID=225848 RepID=A0A1S6HP54_9GAMM|nr:hypothetical protein [Shewanella psychrophila]AQS37311.1 hypothetical protein Sps_02153 [Shewanella psychrophila]
MSPIEHVLSAAKSVAMTGKIPSLALIKTKLGSSIPMPILIQGLQQFKAMDTSAVEKITNLNELHTASVDKDEKSEFDQLKTEFAQLKQAYQNLNSRLEKLENDRIKANQ